ncbi:MAG: carbon-nitrogen hydrolase family protein [Pseudomonadota bacterium]
MNISVCAAALQMTSIDNIDRNLEQADQLLNAAQQAGAELAVLPEYFGWISARDTDKLQFAENEGHGRVQDFLKLAAQRYQLWIVGGTLPIHSPTTNKVYNRCIVVNPQGEIVTHYDKIHLFGLNNGEEKFCESNTIEAGNTPVSAPTPWGNLGLSICYDLRFPELFRALLPFNILALPAAFTFTTGSAHWNTLLRARAIENQCYVIASAQTGTHPGNRKTFGHSQIIDPWGNILACEPEKIGIVTATLNLQKNQEVQNLLPALQHRRFDIFSTRLKDAFHNE